MTGVSIAAGFAIAVIFFTSVYGVHFSMENTKERALNEGTADLRETPARAEARTRGLAPTVRIKEIREMRVWPVNWKLAMELSITVTFPGVLALVTSLLFSM